MKIMTRLYARDPEINRKNSPSHIRKTGIIRLVQSPAEQILSLQRTIGNSAMQKLMTTGMLQAKLRIGRPGDIYEQEADRVAEQVIRMPGPQAVEGTKMDTMRHSQHLQRSCPECEDEKAFRQPVEEEEPIHAEHVSGQVHIMTKGLAGHSCDSASGATREEEEETPVARKSLGETANPEDGAHNIEESLYQTRGGGSPLPDVTRIFMESRFGCDFGHVRLHTDSNAATMTKKVNAEAFTSRNDIYFRGGSYNPQTLSGKKLLAHELTHVVQQSNDTKSGLTVSGKTNTGSQDRIVQCYRLRGFPRAKAAAMRTAIPNAISTVKRCEHLSRWERIWISLALRSKRYDYKKDLGYCGWTFPSSWYIEVGKEAFNRSQCCALSSTLAHEAAHTQWFTEGSARKMECKCFGCC